MLYAVNFLKCEVKVLTEINKGSYQRPKLVFQYGPCFFPYRKIDRIFNFFI